MGRARATKVEDWDQFTVRMPPGMRDKINRMAAKNGRSANAEIVSRLAESLAGNTVPGALQETLQREISRAVEAVIAARQLDAKPDPER